MKMEIVFLMASAFLSVHVDQMNTGMNVETLAKKQTAMTIPKIHPSVPNVSLYFIFSCFSLSFKIVRICAYAIKASVETWKVETVFLKACVTITRRTCTNMKSRQLKPNLLPCSLSLLAGSFSPNKSNMKRRYLLHHLYLPDVLNLVVCIYPIVISPEFFVEQYDHR